MIDLLCRILGWAVILFLIGLPTAIIILCGLDAIRDIWHMVRSGKWF
jgi:hypothetical protein